MATVSILAALQASAGVGVALQLIADDPQAHEQLIEVGVPTAEGLYWLERQMADPTATSVVEAAATTPSLNATSSTVTLASAYVYTHGSSRRFGRTQWASL